MAITYKEATLKNGVRLVMVPSGHATSVTVRAVVCVGSRHETDEVAGVAHFLEHMLFKGTARRPGPMYVNTEVSVRGADTNASTSQDQTEYHVRAASQELPWAMDLIHDMISAPLFDPKELGCERKVVLEELTSGEDNPSSVSQEQACERLFTGSSLARPIIGYRETVEGITRQQLADFHASHYQPTNLIVVVSGGFDPLDAFRLAQATFGCMTPPSVREPGPIPFAAIDSKPTYAVKSMDFTQTHVVLAFRGCAYGQTEQPTQTILGNLLGGDMCSRLWQEIRETRGLAYSVGAWGEHFVDTGSLVTCGEMNADHAVEAVGLFARECASLADAPVPAAELDRVKSMLRGQYALRYESSHSQASLFAEQEFYGVPKATPQECLDKLLAVTAEDVQALARTIFRPDRMTFAAAGKVRAAEEYQEAIEKHLD